MLRSIGCAFALLAIVCSTATADTIAYLSAGAAPPGNLNLDLPNAALGTSGSFDIYIRSNELVAGASLNLIATGNSINLTGVTIPQYAPRWASAQNGVLAADNKSIVGMDAFAIPGFGSNGINPANSGVDSGYNADADAFHYGTVNYSVVGEGETTLKFVIGDIEFGVEGPIFLGHGDDAAAPTGAGSAGATSALADGRIFVAGDVANLPPVVGDGPLIPVVLDTASPPSPTTAVYQFVATDDAPLSELTWTLESFVYNGPGSNTGADPSIDANGKLSWPADGWAGGEYVATVRALDAGGLSDTGSVSFFLTVPEPASLALFGLALVGFVGLRRK